MRAAVLLLLEEVYALRVRIKFAKYDTQRFIGHLDVMRYFQRLFNRSGLPVKYSEGYHPHQILSFAQPLGLGITSDGEYLDLELTKELDTAFIVNALNEKVSNGFTILDCVRLSDREENKKLVTAMSLISRSVYMLILKDGYEVPANEFEKALIDFTTKEKINVLKITKKGEREIDLKEFVYEVCMDTDGFRPIYKAPLANSVIKEDEIGFKTAHAPEFDNGIKFIVSLAAGSETNINPELFIEALISNAGWSFGKEAFRIHRMDLYGGNSSESVPLCQIP